MNTLFQNKRAYHRWREQKLTSAAKPPKILSLENPDALSPGEIEAIRQEIDARGFALYRLSDNFEVTKEWLIGFGEQFGLCRLDSNLCSDPDSVTTLEQVIGDERRRGYIPYTNRPLNWHTDGYYNPPEKRIGAFILHCVQDSAKGGENGLLDPELVWLKMFDENPAWVDALSHPEAMSIPPNVDNGEMIHGWISGPVFYTLSGTSTIRMRYTARKRNIRWREDPATLEALSFLQNLLQSEENGIVWHRLAPNEGMISNNVLHCRKGFENGPGKQRRYYRARYFDHIGRL